MTTCAISKPTQREAKPTEQTRGGRQYQPGVDIVERADELALYADMPGVGSGGFDISFENGLLTIHGRVQERQAAPTALLLEEYGVGDFHRTFQVSESIDANRITAEYSNGVLTLHLPKAESAKVRKIAVRAS